MFQKTPRALLQSLALLLPLTAKAAFAHAIVVASTPRAHENVTKSELRIEIRFNSRIDPARSRLTLVRPEGSSVVLPLAAGGPESDSLTGQASGLENGPHRLLWQTLSLDGHITHGEIPFDVSH
jgi:methionine-rich copper-binding protein CopC